MSRVVIPRIRALTGYTPGEQPPAGSELIKLNTNENPYPASPRVAQAVNETATRLHLYPEPTSEAVRRAAAALYGVRPQNVLVGNGSDELLALCFKACIPGGGRVAYPVPTYSLYRTLADIAGCDAVEVEAFDGGVPSAVGEARADIVFVCTPNSPLGHEIPAARVAAIAEQSKGLVVVDEAYVDFGGTTALSLIERFDNVLVLRTLSKSYSLAGARLGLAFADERLIGELAKVKDSYNVSRLAQAAGQAALEDPDWMRANAKRVMATRERVTAELAALGLGVRPSSANFFWADCAPLGGRAMYDGLRERGILVRYFDVPLLRGGVRVSVGTDTQMDRLVSAVREISRA